MLPLKFNTEHNRIHNTNPITSQFVKLDVHKQWSNDTHSGEIFRSNGKIIITCWCNNTPNQVYTAILYSFKNIRIKIDQLIRKVGK